MFEFRTTFSKFPQLATDWVLGELFVWTEHTSSTGRWVDNVWSQMLDFNWTQQTFVGQLSKSLESINLSVGDPFQPEYGAPTRVVDWVFDV